MPIPESMNWIPSQRRWSRMYKGQRYYVSARQLGCAAETKEASVQAANTWWKQTRAAIDAAELSVHAPRALMPLEDAAAAALGIPPADFFNRLLAFWGRQKDGDADARDAAEHDVRGIVQNVWNELGQALIGNRPLPDGIADYLPPARAAQVERGLKELRGEQAAPPERTVRAQADRWIAAQIVLIGAGSLSADRAEYNRICLSHFAAFIGESADVKTIDAARLHDFHLSCVKKVGERNKDAGRKAGWSVDYAKKVFGTARTFIRFLWENNLIELPRNLDSKGFRFGSTAKRIQTLTVDEVRFVIDKASGKMKLALLLMANCGFTQIDVSDLLDKEVDWIEGRIIRKRSKTGDKDSTPVVNYKLWPITFQLLKQYRAGAGRVLLTESGKAWVRKELVNGRPVKCDSIASNYSRLKERTGFNRPLKLLRKTSASLLEGHEVYGRFVSLFLGHSPRSMKDKHYAAPPQQLFDDAVLWLGGQYGFIDETSEFS